MEDSQDAKEKLLIIDTDAGVDDAQAIVMAIGNPDVKVLAITTVQGNVSARQVSKNVLRLLRISKRQSIPVYQGCESSMIGTKMESTYYHGKDGFGDIPDIHEHENGEIEKEHAVMALIRLVQENPGKISLICLGPLTNIAMALRIYPELGSKLKDCFIMGGNYQGVGNSSMSAEFNFHNDPEAAHVVLLELKCPINLACWELCLEFGVPWEQYDTWLPESLKVSRFFKKAESLSVRFLRENDYQYILCDQIPMAAAVDRTVVTESISVVAHVELSGAKTRGQMVVDWRSKDPPNVTLMKKIDLDKIYKMFRKSLEELDP